MNENSQKLDTLAREVLTLSRNTLLVNLRFLDAALSMFEYFPIEESSLLTDGQHLLYNARHVLERYKSEKEAPVRDYLHVVMHCVFRHMFMDPNLDRPVWDLACDIAVENMITELGLKSTEARRQAAQEKEIEKLKKAVGSLTAEKLYNHFKSQSISPTALAQLRGLFYADNHEIWYMTVTEIEVRFGLGGGSSDPNGDGQSGNSDGQDGEGDGNGQGDRENGSETDDAMMSAKTALAEDWQKISERIQMDVQTFSNGRGGVSQGLIQNLQEVNRERYDYEGFLKKFAVRGEVMKVSDDEFDYVYYTYGLTLYKNLPLIEPLEYKEAKRIREFVIAIDTSGSVVGDLVQKFVQKTFNVIKSTESFFSKINLHLIQCDDQIQEDVKITTQEEFDAYFQTMQLKGFGGNNEVLLFQYVDDLIKSGELPNLKGMIYFTDGYGIFPKKKPDYEVAFVFVENDRWPIPDDIPPWAIKLILRKDEI